MIKLKSTEFRMLMLVEIREKKVKKQIHVYTIIEAVRE